MTDYLLPSSEVWCRFSEGTGWRTPACDSESTFRWNFHSRPAGGRNLPWRTGPRGRLAIPASSSWQPRVVRPRKCRLPQVGPSSWDPCWPKVSSLWRAKEIGRVWQVEVRWGGSRARRGGSWGSLRVEASVPFLGRIDQVRVMPHLSSDLLRSSQLLPLVWFGWFVRTKITFTLFSLKTISDSLKSWPQRSIEIKAMPEIR